MSVPSWLLPGLALLSLVRGALLVKALRSIPALPPGVPAPRADLPSVTIACAARDEERGVGGAVRSWLEQEVPVLQVVVVDDRSSDRTGAVLEGLAASDSRLIALRISERPDGWLGKCHALRVAAAHATGDFILFTDADVRLAPGSLARALARCADEDVDHLVVLPEVETTGTVQRAMTLSFTHELLLALGAWRANRPDGGCALGVGAFNLVRRSAYEGVGGHEEIRMQVGDDVALARLLQRGGYRHRLVSGRDLVSVPWQQGVLGTIRGLEKNAFWGARFSIPLVLAGTAGAIALLAPLAGPLVAGGWGWLALALWLAGTAPPYLVSREPGSLIALVLHPLSLLLLLGAVWSSMIATLARGGVAWRGDLFETGRLKAELKSVRWWRERIPERPAGEPALSGSGLRA